MFFCFFCCFCLLLALRDCPCWDLFLELGRGLRRLRARVACNVSSPSSLASSVGIVGVASSGRSPTSFISPSRLRQLPIDLPVLLVMVNVVVVVEGVMYDVKVGEGGEMTMTLSCGGGGGGKRLRNSMNFLSRSRPLPTSVALRPWCRGRR